MKISKQSFFKIVPVLCVLSVVLVGCNGGESDLGTTVTNPPKDSEDRIKAIENNTHMPQQAKDAAIGAIKAQEEAGKANAENLRKNPPKK